MIQVKRKEKETTGSLLRRFSQRIQQSGILLRAREIRFYKNLKSKRQKRVDALRRERVKREIERLKKLGKK